MIVAIHQPNFLPWVGYFQKMAMAEFFIYLDDVQFTKGGLQNKNKIKTPKGWEWLTVPVLTRGKSGQLTNQVRINNDTKWKKKHLATIRQNYSKAECFEEIYNELEQIYSKDHLLLVDFCYDLLEFCRLRIGICNTIVKSSSLDIAEDLAGTQRLIALLEQVGAKQYISGMGARKYLELSYFEKKEIKVIFHEFSPVPYKQRHGDFLPGLSIIDLLFNVPKDALWRYVSMDVDQGNNRSTCQD